MYLKKYKNLVDNYNVGENDYIRTNMGVIGDKVGSGKSYVILALILFNKCIHDFLIFNHKLTGTTFGVYIEKHSNLKNRKIIIKRI